MTKKNFLVLYPVADSLNFFITQALNAVKQ
jgi:hypothetical protein